MPKIFDTTPYADKAVLVGADLLPVGDSAALTGGVPDNKTSTLTGLATFVAANAVTLSGTAGVLTATAANLTISTVTSGTLAITSAAGINNTSVAVSTWAHSGGAWALNSTSQNVTIATLTAGTIAVTSAGAVNHTSAAASTWTHSGGAFAINSTSQGVTISTITSGTIAITSAGAVNTTSAAASTWAHSGGAFAINSTSQTLTLATLTSGTMALTSAGATNITSAAASVWTVTSADLTISTATSGTLAVTSAGALNLSQAGASTWTVVTSLGLAGGTLNLNASSNFATNINTGTSTGAVTIGNSAAGIVTLANKANTAATFLVTDGTTSLLAIDTRIGITGIETFTFAPPAALSFAGAAGNTYSLINAPAFALTQTGSTGVTAFAGLSILIGSPTVTDASALTVTTASAVQINGPLPAGSVTFTNSYALDIPTFVTNGITAASLRATAPSGAATNYAVQAIGVVVSQQYLDSVAGTAAAPSLTAVAQTGTDTAGLNAAVGGGIGTGAGAGGTLILATPTTLTSGATPQTRVARFTISQGAVTTDAVTVTVADALDFVFNATTGTKIGTATTQKLGFFNATPIVQVGATVDLGTVLSNLGLRAAGTAYPITTSGALSLTGTTIALNTITTYKTVVTAGWGVGAIYGQGRVDATTDARAAAAAAYTVGAADGSFQVSGNVLVTTSTTHSFSLDVSYTDESSTARVLILPMAQLAGAFVAGGLITNVTGAGPYESAVMQIRCKAATAITIRVSAGTFTTVVYNSEGLIQQVA